MGFMDNFTSDSPVTVKQPDYYAMVKEAAKAELITNAVNAEVPGYYIQAMITGKKPDFLNTMDTEEEETGFRTEYEQITGAVVSIFEAWEKENGVESAADGLHRLPLLLWRVLLSCCSPLYVSKANFLFRFSTIHNRM